jgi:hypothetical protein
MFNVGDLVRFRRSGIVKTRYNSTKILGIVTWIERDMFNSYDGRKDDLVIVKWLPLNEEERMMEFYLEHLTPE